MSVYVTQALGKALLELMRSKNLERITVDEMTEKGQIGRATYFRNYSSKEEVLTDYIVLQWRTYEREHNLKAYPIRDRYRIVRYFEFLKSLRPVNDLLIGQGRTAVILNAYERIFDEEEIELSYERAYMAYGLYGILLLWIKNGYLESPEEMSRILSERIFAANMLDRMDAASRADSGGDDAEE